jgi:hypothetical protein
MLTKGLARTQDSLGKLVSTNPHQAKSWWCKETLDPIISVRNRARQWFILTKSPKAADCYQQWNLFFRSTAKSLKRNDWLRFLENPTGKSLWKALKVTKKSASRTILPLQRQDGTLTSDKPLQAELLFRGTSCINAPISLADIPDRPPLRLVCFSQVFPEEVGDCIWKISSKKAPGIDRITNELLN